MSLRFIDAGELARTLPVEAAVDALERAFAREPQFETPRREHLETDGGELLLMPAAGRQGTGVKLVTVNPVNPERSLPLIQGVYVLFSPETMSPEAVIDGAALTALRTAAVSALATRYLARPDASRLVIFGAGTQARAHLEAMPAVRPVEEVVVVSRTREGAERLAEAAGDLHLRARVAGAKAVSRADIVCTCTTSATPVFDGELLPPGAHVNAVGAYRPEARELDGALVRRASVVVETREAALAEAGDLLIPIREGEITAAHIAADLSEVVRGAVVRTGVDDITVFKSVGVAFEDLVVARAAVERV